MGVLKRRAEPKTDDSILLGRISWTQQSMATLAPVKCWDLVSSFWILKSVNKHRLSCLKLFTLNQVHLKCILSFCISWPAWTAKSHGRGDCVKHSFGLGVSGLALTVARVFPSRAPQCYTRGFSSLERSLLEIKEKKSYRKINKKACRHGEGSVTDGKGVVLSQLSSLHCSGWFLLPYRR